MKDKKKEKESSPMMQQYKRIKGENEDSILFFRLGDFYEMFNEDAKIVSKELDLVLTGKDCGLDERAPMCGIPYHSCESYIARLIAKGYKVAICEQTEDPSKAKKLVNREVVRVITPGTVIESSMLDESKNNYLAAVFFGKESAGVCFTDASTGESNMTEISGENVEERVINEIMRFSPAELLLTEKAQKHPVISSFIEKHYEGIVTKKDEGFFNVLSADEIVCKTFGVISPENLGIKRASNLLISFGAVLQYLKENGTDKNLIASRINIYTQAQFMRVDMTAVRNLELCETMRSKSKRGSLLGVLDKTKTAMGKRLIRSWIEMPLLSIAEITLRQNAIEELFSDTMLRGEEREYLNNIRDVERIIAKIIYGSVSPKEMLSLAATSHYFPLIRDLLKNSNSRMLKEVYESIDTVEEIVKLIDDAIDTKAPQVIKEGKIIKDGYNEQVDKYRDILDNGANYLKQIETREREKTGIKGLKVRYNKVFGYYIEVTNSFLDKVPEDYVRRQTLTNSERYITEELKQLESEVLTAKEKVFQLEYEIFDGIRKKASDAAKRFRKTALAIAKLDALCSLAEVAVNNNYCRPVINDSGAINIKNGRHPVVEQLIKTPFVSNDTFLNLTDERCAVITGPNMAGKSTYMRQVALITLMAQIGSFVPAQTAQIGLVDAIFTRVGASDDLASGQSTFMVEMSEVAEIIKSATKKSLLILDEIGRGTSTFDGMSIARAVLEYVADKKKLGAKTLFATHYHELTEMENELDGVKNYNIAVKKRGDDIIFLRRIVRGGADESYGIEVAKLSGIPSVVTDRAKQILKQTEENGIVTYKTAAAPDAQIPLEMQGATDIFNELKTIDVNTLTPIEAMGILFDIVNKAKSL